MVAITDVRTITTNRNTESACNEPAASTVARVGAVLCSSCNLRDLCLPSGVSQADTGSVDELVSSRRRIKRGQRLYNAGARFEVIYAVRSGFFKSYAINSYGREQVTGFQMAGDILGLEGIAGDVHSVNVEALEDATVCVIPFQRVEQLATRLPTLQRQLHRIMGREIVRDQNLMILLGNMQAEERVAAFLLNLSQRFAARGYAAAEFLLRMTREEIGSYLGLKLETVSRAFSKFQQTGLIDVQQKHVRLRDLPGLEAVLARAA